MASYERSVFVNCPFDDQYSELFEAVNFAIFDCGFDARSVLERTDGGETRIRKLMTVVSECRYGIHDLSRTELDADTRLPRFNMPFELGVFLGVQWLGPKKQRTKRCLVLDTERYRYRDFCSDIAGQDIEPHNGEPQQAVTAVRNWLGSFREDVVLPGGSALYTRLQQFQRDKPLLCDSFRLKLEEVQFDDFKTLVSSWLLANPL